MITLQVDGRNLSLEEIEAIVRQHFSKEKEAQQEEKNPIEKPTEGKWFKVNPGKINQDLFQKKRNDKRQEQTRQLILDAFEMAEKFPKSYGKPFQTMMPEKTWTSKTIEELIGLASRLGDHNADWVEQALEWAQRIQNGETWEEVCNELDTANWYRLVIWKDEYARLVGGSRKNNVDLPASDVSYCNYNSNDNFNDTVPLVVL